ncbi:MAG: phosphoribosyltransferase, partial [Synergistaceae bacterium]|nr:phosphoribosyltransferase [Synergistaceae bacterium]
MASLIENEGLTLDSFEDVQHDTLTLLYPKFGDKIRQARGFGYSDEAISQKLNNMESGALQYYDPAQVAEYLGRTPENIRTVRDYTHKTKIDAYETALKGKLDRSAIERRVEDARLLQVPDALLLDDDELYKKFGSRIEKLRKERDGLVDYLKSAVFSLISGAVQTSSSLLTKGTATMIENIDARTQPLREYDKKLRERFGLPQVEDADLVPAAEALIELGRFMDQKSRELAKYGLDGRDAALSDQVSQGIGSILTYFIPGFAAARAAKVGAAGKLAAFSLSAGGLESLTEGGNVFEQQLAQGASVEEALKAANMTGLLQFPVNALTNALGGYLGGGAMIRQMIARGLSEMTQETIQGVLSGILSRRKQDGTPYTWGDLVAAMPAMAQAIPETWRQEGIPAFISSALVGAGEVAFSRMGNRSEGTIETPAEGEPDIAPAPVGPDTEITEDSQGQPGIQGNLFEIMNFESEAPNIFQVEEEVEAADAESTRRFRDWNMNEANIGDGMRDENQNGDFDQEYFARLLDGESIDEIGESEEIGEPEEIRFTPSRPWPQNFPRVTQMGDTYTMRSHERYEAAKGGDAEAATSLVLDLLGNEEQQTSLRQIGERHPGAILVPVHLDEDIGRNKIPAALAKYIGKITGLEVNDDIVQKDVVTRTGVDMWDRIAFRPKFDGQIQAGKQYILVDDVVTQGGTFGELRRYIEMNGGEVVDMITIGAARNSTQISLSRKNKVALERRFGVESLQNFLLEMGLYGGNYESLTNSEALALLSSETLDAARARILQARNQRSTQEDRGASGNRVSETGNQSGGELESFTSQEYSEAGTEFLPNAPRTPNKYNPDEWGLRWGGSKEFVKRGRDLQSQITKAAEAKDEQKLAALRKQYNDMYQQVVDGTMETAPAPQAQAPQTANPRVSNSQAPKPQTTTATPITDGYTVTDYKNYNGADSAKVEADDGRFIIVNQGEDGKYYAGDNDRKGFKTKAEAVESIKKRMKSSLDKVNARFKHPGNKTLEGRARLIRELRNTPVDEWGAERYRQLQELSENYYDD